MPFFIDEATVILCAVGVSDSCTLSTLSTCLIFGNILIVRLLNNSLCSTKCSA